MKTTFLLPFTFKRVGWMLLIPGLVLGIIYLIYDPEPAFLDLTVWGLVDESLLGDTRYFASVENNVFDEIVGLLLIVGALFVAFSKEKQEDEFIARTRLESLVWATYVNYAILLLAIIFVYSFPFFWVLVFNMFTILFFFIVRFNWARYRANNLLPNEE